MSTLFFDVDTQLDFLFPAGALYVPGAEKIIHTVGALNRWAVQHGIPLISTTDAHLEDDPEFALWPAHCVAGTTGQRKPQETLAEKHAVVPVDSEFVFADGVEQYLVEKRHVDCFTNPNLPRLLERLGAERCVVYGVVTEICVRHAAFGLLARGFKVELVTDAVQSLDAKAAEAMLREFEQRGGRLTTAAEQMSRPVALQAR